jgi:hypothetical protein
LHAPFGKRPTEKDLTKGTSPAVDFTLRGPGRSNAPRLPDYGSDAVVLLRAVHTDTTRPWLGELPAVEVLRRMLVQNYVIIIDAAGREVIRAREAEQDGLPPGRVRLSSPYDLDARWAGKGDDLYWNGYKVHVSETCDTPDPAPGGGDPATGSPATARMGSGRTSLSGWRPWTRPCRTRG